MSDSNWDLCDEPLTGHPVEKHRRVKIIEHIRNNETLEIREYHSWTIFDPEDGDAPSDYMWSDGNYACDCNRALHFEYAVGAKYDEVKEINCGQEKFSVNVANAKTGEVFYREFE